MTFDPTNLVKPGDFKHPMMRTTIPNATEAHPVAITENEVVFCVHFDEDDLTETLAIPRELLSEDVEEGCELARAAGDRHAHAVWN